LRRCGSEKRKEKEPENKKINLPLFEKKKGKIFAK
jgi:hypothetical protein